MQNGWRKRNRGGGAMTVEGRRSQIAHKLGHGIRGISPVLLKVESEQAWREHYESVYRSVNPGSEFEADLAYLLAWQLWRIGRLIRHETALTTEKIHKPPESIFDIDNNPTVTKGAILDAIARLEWEKRNGNSRKASSKQPKADSKNSLLSRCRAIESTASDVMFAHRKSGRFSPLYWNKYAGVERRKTMSRAMMKPRTTTTDRMKNSPLKSAGGPLTRLPSRFRSFQRRRELIGARNCPG
jgi:hypothetical protein